MLLDSSLRHDARPPTADQVDATLAWLDSRINSAAAAASDTPYAPVGSPEWLALPDNDPARWLSVLCCGRAWYLDLVRLPERVRAEVAEMIELCELYLAERDRIDAEIRREITKDCIAAMERHERELKRRGVVLPSKSGPELIADAHRSWGLPVPGDVAALRRAA